MNPPAYTSKIIGGGLLKLGRDGIIRALGSWPDYAAPPPRGIDPFALTSKDAELLARAMEDLADTAKLQDKSSLRLAARFLRQFVVPASSLRVARRWISRHRG